MRTTVKFRLETPTREKWDIYISLIPKIDRIMRQNDVELLKRLTEELHFTTEELLNYSNEESYTQTVIELTKFTNSHKLLFKLIRKIDEPSPEGFKTTLTLRLRDGYRSQTNWDTWIKKMPAVKDYCTLNGVHLSRELDMKNYSVRATAYYNRPHEIATAFFVSGWIYGQSNINLEIADIFEETYSLDLIEDMKKITNKKKRR